MIKCVVIILSFIYFCNSLLLSNEYPRRSVLFMARADLKSVTPSVVKPSTQVRVPARVKEIFDDNFDTEVLLQVS